MPNHLNMPKTVIMGALPVASGLVYEFYPDLPKTIHPYLGICTKFDIFWPTLVNYQYFE